MSKNPERATSVVLFMHDFSRTGVVLNAVRLANALAARGHPTCILVCNSQGALAQRLDAAVRVEQIGGIASRPGLGRGLALLAGLPALRRALVRLQPDVLLSAGNHAHLPAMLASMRLPQMRRVLRISNDLDHPGDSWLVRGLRRFIHRRLLLQADRLLLVSRHLATHPVLAEAEAAGKVIITPNGVPLEEIRRQASLGCEHPWIGGTTPVIAAMGRLTRQKNLPTLIRAFARAVQHRPLKLVIIGGGGQSEQQRLNALAAQLGVAEHVRLEGEMANPHALLARCNTFVLPSLWEGASNALLEALACGLPVVAARSAGNAQQVLGYGRHGLLVDPLDIDGLAQSILYQSGSEACLPGSRAAEFALGNTLARACAAIVADVPDTPEPYTLAGEHS